MKRFWVVVVSVSSKLRYLNTNGNLGLYRKRKRAMRDFEKIVKQKCKWSKSPSNGAWVLETEIPGIVSVSMLKWPIDKPVGCLFIEQSMHDAMLLDEQEASAMSRYLNELDNGNL